MKFLQRSHYCRNCKKKMFFLRFTSKKYVESKLKCSICNTEVISYWEEINQKFIIPIIIGMAFFTSAFIYSLWRYSVNEVLTRDIIIMILTLVLATTFAIYGLKYRNRSGVPNKSDYDLKKLSRFRKQSFLVLIWLLIGLALSVIINIIVWFIWEWISILALR
ncbi:MAG: hypothetical protein ACFFDS_05265 [Candidatus Thorarchaeota archaeon]